MKKGLCLLLSILMIVTAATTVSAASFTDTEGKSCETAVEVLSALGIVEGKGEGAYEPDSLLTRTELATIILRAINTQALGGQDIFTDVPASHWGYKYVTTAYQKGIINGMSATTFEPDASVTYEQAVTMVVRALGYDVHAQAEGGYPSGYLTKAAQLDLLKGVKTDSPMKRGDMANLIYNALDVTLLVKESYGNDAYSYKEKAGTSLLASYLKVGAYEGTVAAAPTAKIAEIAVKDDEVAILLSKDAADLTKGESINIKKGETAIQEMVGVPVTVYTKADEKTEAPVAVAVVAKTDCDIYTVSAADISAETEADTFVFTNAEGKEQTIDITNATLVRNGKAQSSVTLDAITPDIGSVKIIKDSKNVTIIVDEYTNYVVKKVDKDDLELVLEGAQSIPLSVDPEKRAVSITDANGAAVAVADIEKQNIVSLAMDDADHEKAKVVRIKVSAEEVDGTIDEMNKKGVTIGDKVYKVALADTTKPVSVGTTAMYYLDFMGNIAAFDEEASSIGGAAVRQYGWLVTAKMTSGIDGYPKLKVYTAAGEMQVFDVKEKIEFNGKVVEPSKLLSGKATNPLYNNNASATEIVPQLVAYEENDDGKLLSLDASLGDYNLTDHQDTSIDASERKDKNFSFDYYMDHKPGTNVYSAVLRKWDGSSAAEPSTSGPVLDVAALYVSGTFMGKLQITKNTKVFVIPAAGSDDDDYAMRKVSSLNQDASVRYNCLGFYDVNEQYQVGALVFFDGLAGIGADKYPNILGSYAVVTGQQERMNEDRVRETVLSVFDESGKEMDFVVTDNAKKKIFYTSANADVANDKKENGSYVWRTSEEDEEYMDMLTWTLHRPELYISIEDLQPGDVIRYTEHNGELLNASVVHRATKDLDNPYLMEVLNYNIGITNKPDGQPNKDEKDKLVTVNREVLYTGNANAVYEGGKNLLSCAKVVDVSSSGLTVETYNGKLGTDTRNKYSTGIKTNQKLTHVFPNVGKFVEWDSKTQTAKAITIEDVMEDDIIFSAWASAAQRIVVVYR